MTTHAQSILDDLTHLASGVLDFGVLNAYNDVIAYAKVCAAIANDNEGTPDGPAIDRDQMMILCQQVNRMIDAAESGSTYRRALGGIYNRRIEPAMLATR